jgi:hypothetical protein
MYYLEDLGINGNTKFDLEEKLLVCEIEASGSIKSKRHFDQLICFLLTKDFSVL